MSYWLPFILVVPYILLLEAAMLMVIPGIAAAIVSTLIAGFFASVNEKGIIPLREVFERELSAAEIAIQN